ncbi:nuclear transport factor 2 family protein [Emticicia sp. BO119]|uniref:nuclear transport factor 2 family protein n=1 Tax=Emticicia sp. BO119 TaxID=2757768 RepID=UPI0015F0CAAC|nr:nuclear transport factor 2 family protein [Emticicia sp. BO119]MBA4851146.1 nuclear transport factor 2 family protein [Emticicia sp. BO119]
MQKLSLIVFCLLAQFSVALAQKSDLELVKETVQNYLDGGTYGDTAKMAQVFHPSAFMKFVDVKTGEFRDVPIARYLENGKANAGKKIDRTTKILNIDITGTAAQAKLELDMPNTKLTDYFNLLKINGEWKVVSKIFTREDKK